MVFCFRNGNLKKGSAEDVLESCFVCVCIFSSETEPAAIHHVNIKGHIYNNSAGCLYEGVNTYMITSEESAVLFGDGGQHEVHTQCTRHIMLLL